MSADPVALARRLVDAARAGQPDGAAAAELAALRPSELAASLIDHARLGSDAPVGRAGLAGAVVRARRWHQCR